MLRVFMIIIISIGLYVVAANCAFGETIKTESTTNSNVNTKNDTNTTVNSPPPSAISPSINSSNADLCTVGVSGAVQTQILGISAGKTIRDMNCERLKLAKTMYDMGMKVAAVSIMCQDARVFDAMEMAGTPCPFLGKIGDEAQKEWGSVAPPSRPESTTWEEKSNEKTEGFLAGGALGIILMLLLI